GAERPDGPAGRPPGLRDADRAHRAARRRRRAAALRAGAENLPRREVGALGGAGRAGAAGLAGGRALAGGRRVLQVDDVPPRADGAHRLEAVLDHVTVELDAIAVGIGEVDAARHVVLDGRLDGDPDRLELAVRRLQLLEAAELPRHVVQARLGGV